MPLAIFDLDNTLLNGDSDHAWGEFLVQQGIVDAKLHKTANDLFYEQYQNGDLNIKEYLRFSFKTLSQHSKDQLDAWHQLFMQTMIAPMRLKKADALIEYHRQKGDFLLIITATNSFITKPIANLLGVNDILASDPEFINGVFTGNIAGIPCFQEGKVTRLKMWLEETGHTLENSFFYSDSHNDLPLLKMVDNPVVVDADEKLTAYALEQGWKMISLRN